MATNEPQAAYLGRPAAELTDEELEQQGKNAHDTRNWVFLHGTAEQFATHTQRMLELENEYLKRHPHRTWQGTEGGEDVSADPDVVRSRVLAAFAEAGGSLHKLEAHQTVRRFAPDARLVASLYKEDPPLLRADGDQRTITDAGRAWLADHP